MAQPTILINLQRCTGCWTCSMACKVGNKLDLEEWWQHVRTIGGAGIDEPSGTWPDVHMSWMPIHTSDCTLCGARTDQGQEPFCTYNCPTKAMTYGDLDDPQSLVSQKIDELRGRGFRIFKLPEWERSRSEIIYASKG